MATQTRISYCKKGLVGEKDVIFWEFIIFAKSKLSSIFETVSEIQQMHVHTAHFDCIENSIIICMYDGTKLGPLENAD